MSIFNRKPKEADIREAARIVSVILLELKELTKPDVNLNLLDEIASRRIKEMGASSCNFQYKPDWAVTPYPATICASVNHEICHAPPGGRTLRNGDIVTYDLGVRYKSGCGDAALTVAVGEIDNRKQRAMRYGLQTLYAGIKVVQAGQKIGSIGEAMERYASISGYNIIEEFGSHHIGKEMHEKPYILNYTNYQDPSFREELKEGAVICLEPMLTPGNGNVAISKRDGWTAYCPDGQSVVMFEAMIKVLAGGYEILTCHLPPVDN